MPHSDDTLQSGHNVIHLCKHTQNMSSLTLLWHTSPHYLFSMLNTGRNYSQPTTLFNKDGQSTNAWRLRQLTARVRHVRRWEGKRGEGVFSTRPLQYHYTLNVHFITLTWTTSVQRLIFWNRQLIDSVVGETLVRSWQLLPSQHQLLNHHHHHQLSVDDFAQHTRASVQPVDSTTYCYDTNHTSNIH